MFVENPSGKEARARKKRAPKISRTEETAHHHRSQCLLRDGCRFSFFGREQ
jgi:hypothetical protein